MPSSARWSQHFCMAAATQPRQNVRRRTSTAMLKGCVCRHLEWETDSYSRLPYEDMVQICNETVLSSNPNRYPKELNSRPKLVDLRCQEDVEPWLEAVEENRVLEESNRRLFEEVKQQIDQDSSEENDS